jgi:hypothetical protein
MVCNDKAHIASEILEKISKIYEIEDSVRGSPADQRLKIRQEKSSILVKDLFASFKLYKKKLPQKGATVKAINYAMNNEVALFRFLDDGKIEIDNNIAERAMRSIALGRKNYLFAGSDIGGEIAANIYSLIETCKANKINPELYLTKVLSIIQSYNSQKITNLLPWNLKLD